MYKALIDSNIFVDFMFHRQPFYNDSEKVISLCENRIIKGYVTTSMLMDLHYIFKKLSHSNSTANTAISEIMKCFEVIDVEKSDIVTSITNNRKDFEDGVIESCSINNRIDYIITRNVDDFDGKEIEVLSPNKAITEFKK